MKTRFLMIVFLLASMWVGAQTGPKIQTGVKLKSPVINSDVPVTVKGQTLNRVMAIGDSVKTLNASKANKADTVTATNYFYTESEVDRLLSRFLGVDSIRYDTTRKRFRYKASDRWYGMSVHDSTSVSSTLLTGLYGSWHLNEASGSVIDVLGLNNGTNSGATANTSTKFSTGYDFTAVGNYLQFVYTTLPTSNTRTISMWINVDILASTAARDYILGSEVLSDFSTKWSVKINTSNGITMQVNNTVPTTFIYTSANSVIASTGTWYNVIWVLPDVGQMGKIYINGVLSSSGSPTAVTGTSKTSNYRWTAGNTQGGSLAIDGKIDDISYWNREITSTEAAYIYNSGTGRVYPYSTW